MMIFETRTFFAFDVPCTLVAAGPAARVALASAEELCHRYEGLFSHTRDTSDVSRLNRAAGARTAIDPETAELLRISLAYCAASGGRFDITAGELARLWNYHAARVPSEAEIKAALGHVGYWGVHVDGAVAWLDDPAARITLGGTAKGYIADRVRGHLLANGAVAGMVNLGGNIAMYGSREDGLPWEVALDDPLAPGSVAAIIEVGEAAVVTSGVTERTFVRDGRAYHHIVDLATGRPVVTDIASVTVVAPEAMVGEGWSTTLLAAGSTAALALAAEHGLEIAIIRADRAMLTTPGLAPRGRRLPTHGSAALPVPVLRLP